VCRYGFYFYALFVSSYESFLLIGFSARVREPGKQSPAFASSRRIDSNSQANIFEMGEEGRGFPPHWRVAFLLCRCLHCNFPFDRVLLWV